MTSFRRSKLDLSKSLKILENSNQFKSHTRGTSDLLVIPVQLSHANNFWIPAEFKGSEGDAILASV